MNNRLYEYMRLGNDEDEKKYKEELFDTKKIVKVTDADIEAYNKEKEESAAGETNASLNNSENLENNKSVENEESYIEQYRKNEEFYHYRSPFSKARKKAPAAEPVQKDYNTMDSSTSTMGMIGKDRDYDLFPWLHREIAYLNDFNYSYTAFDVSGENLENAIVGSHALGIKGFNVADSFKEDIIPKLKAIGKSAYLIGAVDTLVYKEDGYLGFNTQMAGVKKCLMADGVSLAGRNILITGISDAVSALIVAAADLKARNIVVLTSMPHKYDKCINRVKSTYDATDIHVITPEDDYLYEINQLTTIKNFKWICFYTGDNMPDDVDLFERIEIGYDLAFDRISTEFTTRLLECESAADNGLRFRIYQAIASYELWSSKKAVQGTAEYIYKKLKKKLYK